MQKKGFEPVLLRWVALGLACILAWAVRLFGILRFEAMIHEFDPYFNFRATEFLHREGLREFLDQFDHTAWYPLGRHVGGTVYPGLMATSHAIKLAAEALNLASLELRHVCIFISPLFASLTVIATYLLTAEVHSSGAGLVAAAMVAIAPGYVSRSVAGSYDNESVAIFCLVFTFYAWLKAVKTGQVYWASLCSLSYFYMVSSWGGYVFLINLMGLHVLALMVGGRFSDRTYVSYSVVYSLGTLLSMQIPFVGTQPVQSSELLMPLLVFGLCQLHQMFGYLRTRLSGEELKWAVTNGLVGLILAATLVLWLGSGGWLAPWTGRLMTLLDPWYAKKFSPIVASVSEHQPTAWSSFFFDLHIMTILFPAGLYFCIMKTSAADPDLSLFVVLYGITALYFTGVMVRLMLVLTPVMCVLSGIAVSSSLATYVKYLVPEDTKAGGQNQGPKAKKGSDAAEDRLKETVGCALVVMMSFFLVTFVYHSVWATRLSYSSPSLVLDAHDASGNRILFDDFREAYYWLRMNTPEDSVVMSWWDYGYQLSAMANRTTVVDNNTWNNTHIARVGQAMAQDEEAAYKILRQLDVDYLLVVFGGVVAYRSDDISKFLWMVRIGASVESGGHIKEWEFYNSLGEFRVDASSSEAFRNSLMYKMCYHQFGQVYTMGGRPSGFDRVREAEIGLKEFELKHIEEAYTTSHWIVRIYRVKKEANRGLS